MAEKSPIYILSAATLGPGQDTAYADRRSLTEDAMPLDLQALLKTFTEQDLRRAGHFTELAVAGSQLCISRLKQPLNQDTAVYFSTGLGEVQKTVALFQQVMDEDTGLVSPYSFVNSVSSTAGFYVAKAAGLKSRNLTVCQEEFSFEAAFKLAQTDLENNEVDFAMVGGADECSHPRAEHMHRIQLEDSQPMGEGSGWLCLGKTSRHAIGEVLMVREITGDTPAAWLTAVEGILSPWLKKGHKTYLLPGFRLEEANINNLLNRLPEMELKDYLDYCGCFHTAAAFGLASVFDEKRKEPALYFHINRNTYGRTMIVGVYAFPR